MASYTPNYNLKKPADSDSYDIADDNGNMDKIDTALNTLNSNLANYSYADATKVGNYWVSGLIRAHRKGYVVTLKLDNMAINAVSGRTQIATIPNGYRPITEVAFHDDSNSRMYIVSADGSVKAETQSAGNIWGAITYVCNR